MGLRSEVSRSRISRRDSTQDSESRVQKQWPGVPLVIVRRHWDSWSEGFLGSMLAVSSELLAVAPQKVLHVFEANGSSIVAPRSSIVLASSELYDLDLVKSLKTYVTGNVAVFVNGNHNVPGDVYAVIIFKNLQSLRSHSRRYSKAPQLVSETVRP